MSTTLFPEVDQIIALLSKESEQDLVIVVVPSHDKNKREIPDQDRWADAAMRTLSDLYRGATSFVAHAGIFKDDEGMVHIDRPIIIESYAEIARIEDPMRLNKLVGFVRRMGRETKQKSVMVVFGNVMFYVEDFTGPN